MNTSTASASRLEAFSDGVFAIAITLLVLEIKVPHHDELHSAGGLWRALEHRWPSYFGYVLSFLVIGVMWINHHTLFEYIRRVNRPLLVANLLLLMGVAFLPFPTAVLAEHLADPSTRAAATAFYGATLVFTSLTFNVLWWVGRRETALMGDELSKQGVNTITRRYAVAFACYVAATALAYVNVWLSLAIHFILALWNGLSERTAKGDRRNPTSLP
jgi:TMEM175 potassium channel family protein